MNKAVRMILTTIGVICLLFSWQVKSQAFAPDYLYWPLWPVPSYFPEPPKVLYIDENEYEIVVDANSTEPLTFFSIGRDIMAWGDRMPMIAGKIEKSGSEYYFVPLSGESLPLQAWGARMELLAVKPSPIIKYPLLPAKNPKIYLGLGEIATDIEAIGVADLNDFSVVPAWNSAWYDADGDNVPEEPNQEFSMALNTSWVDFLENYEFLKTISLRTLVAEDPIYISDGGHSAPVIVWPDNIWLAPMSDWLSFYKSLSYESFGGAAVFFATNDGRVRAFSVGEEGGSTYEELWSFIPAPALLVAPYYEYWEALKEVKQKPRLIALDGQILIHDIEDAGNPGKWKRILVGTTGQGSLLQYKPKEAWKFDIPEEAPPSGVRGHLFGVYALDLTDLADPRPFWSVSTGKWNDNDDVKQSSMWIDGQYVAEISDGYEPYEGLSMSLARPVMGYTYNFGVRTWHVLLLGIDSQTDYHVYDIDAATGKCLKDYVLGKAFSIQAPDGVSYPNDVIQPSRMAAALMWPDSFPTGTSPYTPLLGEVYLYLSNGTIYEWDVQSGTAPELLLTLTGGQTNEVAMPLQDFDVTFLYVEGDDKPHRFLAAVSGFSKNGNPSDVLNTDHYGLITVDVTLLKEEGSPATVTLGDSAFGQTNTVRTETPYLDFTYISMRSVDEDATDFGKNKGSHWKTAYPSSAPIFYDGKVILITRSYWTKKQGNSNFQGEWSRTYVVDPLADTVQKVDVSGVTHLGGALIDENALLFLQTSGGAISQDLSVFGLAALGETSLEGETGNETGDPEVVYWKVLD